MRWSKGMLWLVILYLAVRFIMDYIFANIGYDTNAGSVRMAGHFISIGVLVAFVFCYIICGNIREKLSSSRKKTGQ